MMLNKTYKINGVECILNDDLTLRQQEFVSQFFKGAFVQEKVINLGNFKFDEVKKFFQTILLKADGTELPKDFDFGEMKESVQLEVLKDFFLSRIQRAVDMQSSLTN